MGKRIPNGREAADGGGFRNLHSADVSLARIATNDALGEPRAAAAASFYWSLSFLIHFNDISEVLLRVRSYTSRTNSDDAV